MVRYFALLAAVVATLVVVDAAQARGRRGGCHGGSCYASGGCAGGSCYVGGGGYKTAAIVEGADPIATEAPPTPAVVNAAPQAAPRYVTTTRRGWFARRR